MVRHGNSTYKFNYQFLKKYAKELFDADVERGEPPDGAFALATDDGRFLAAYDGVSWVTPKEDGYDHLSLTIVWTPSHRDAIALGNIVAKSEKFLHLGMGVRFAVFQVRLLETGYELVQLHPFKEKPEEPKPEEPKPEEPKPEEPKPEEPKPEPPPTTVGEQWQDNAVPGPDVPENKDDEEVPQ